MNAGERWRRIAIAIASSAAPVIAGPASAQPTPSDRALAEALFRDARELMKQKAWDQACPKLEESERLDPAGGTLLNLGLCHEAQGRLAAAWAELRDALAIAKKDGAAERQRIAAEHIGAIEPKVPRLIIDVPDNARAAGLEISIDGAPIHQPAWQTAVPTDPGAHLVSAQAPGRQRWETSLRLESGSGQTRITIPVLAAAAGPSAIPPPASTAAAPRATRDSSTMPAPAAPGGSAARVGGFVALGVAVIGIGVGSYFGIRAIDKRQQSNDECPREACTNRGLMLNDEAKSAATVSNVTFAIGAVAAATGIVLLLVSNKRAAPSAPRAAVVTRAVGPRVGAQPLVGHAHDW